MSRVRGYINIFVQYTHVRVCAQYFKTTETLLIDVFIYASFFSDTGIFDRYTYERAHLYVGLFSASVKLNGSIFFLSSLLQLFAC